MRRDVHPLEEANGFRALLNLEEPKYSIEQLAAKTGKSPVYVATRLKLTELSQNVVDAFYREEIASVMRSCWRSSSPRSRNRHSPLASKRIGVREARRQNASCFP